jgi:hypothetical protein
MSRKQTYYFLHDVTQSAWREEMTALQFEKRNVPPSIEVVDKEKYLCACSAWGVDPEEMTQ